MIFANKADRNSDLSGSTQKSGMEATPGRVLGSEEKYIIFEEE
ncbi:MAG: hypothetical protein ACOCZM_02245 [Bacillota bacterium]